jgi:Phasin protein
MPTEAPTVAELNERLLETGKRVGNLYLDTCEKTVEGVTALQRKLAEQAHNETVRTVVDAQADLTRDLAKTYVAAAREAIA